MDRNRAISEWAHKAYTLHTHRPIVEWVTKKLCRKRKIPRNTMLWGGESDIKSKRERARKEGESVWQCAKESVANGKREKPKTYNIELTILFISYAYSVEYHVPCIDILRWGIFLGYGTTSSMGSTHREYGVFASNNAPYRNRYRIELARTRILFIDLIYCVR